MGGERRPRARRNATGHVRGRALPPAVLGPAHPSREGELRRGRAHGASYDRGRARGRAPPPAVGSASTRRACHVGGWSGERRRLHGAHPAVRARAPSSGAVLVRVLHRRSRVLPRRERGSELGRRVRELDLRRRVQSCCRGTKGKNRGLPLLSRNKEEERGRVVDTREVT